MNDVDPSDSPISQSEGTLLTKKRSIFSYSQHHGGKDASLSPELQSDWTPEDIVLLRPLSSHDNKQTTIYFEASRSLLIRESQVFADLFRIAQKPASRAATRDIDGADMYDGHPLIPCYDNPTELEKFLEAVHDHRVYFQSEAYWQEFFSVSAILRLATKYQVEHLRNDMIRFLEKYHYATSLSGLQSFGGLTSDPPTQSFLALGLLSETSARRLLPCAYLKCAVTLGQLDLVDLLDVPVPPEPPRPNVVGWFADADHKRRCINGVQWVQAQAAAHVRNAMSTICRDHQNDSPRSGHGFGCKRRALEFLCSPDRASASLILLPYVFTRDFDSCCRDTIRVSLEEDIQKFWMALPEKFQLPPWEVLLENESDGAER